MLRPTGPLTGTPQTSRAAAAAPTGAAATPAPTPVTPGTPASAAGPAAFATPAAPASRLAQPTSALALRASVPSSGIDFPSPYKDIRPSPPARPARSATPAPGPAFVAGSAPTSTPASRKVSQPTSQSLMERGRAPFSASFSAMASRLGQRSERGAAVGKAIAASGRPDPLTNPSDRERALIRLLGPEAGPETDTGTDRESDTERDKAMGTAAGASRPARPTETETSARARAEALRPELARIVHASSHHELKAHWEQFSSWVDEPQDERTNTPYNRHRRALFLELVAERHLGKHTPASFEALETTLKEVEPKMAACRNFRAAQTSLDMRLHALCRLAPATQLHGVIGSWGYIHSEQTPPQQALHALVLHHVCVGIHGLQGARKYLIDAEPPVSGPKAWPVLEQMCLLACRGLTPAEHQDLMRLFKKDKPMGQGESGADNNSVLAPDERVRAFMRQTLEAYKPPGAGARGSLEDVAPSPASASGLPSGASEAKGAGGGK